jgi:DNA repair exonuclease SbcCD ATPase subunit
MSELAETTTPITPNQADIHAMVETAVEAFMPRMAQTIKNELGAFEERMEAQYIRRTEFEELRKKFNALPPKLAPAADVEEMQRRLTEAEAKTQLLSGQMTTLMGNQTQLRDKVLQLSESEARTNQERAQLQTAFNLTLSIVQNIHEEQDAARREREAMRQRYDELRDTVAATQARQRDTDTSFKTTITRIHDLLFGSPETNQVGLPKQMELLGNQIAATNTKLAESMNSLDEYKTWVDNRRKLEKVWRERLWALMKHNKLLTGLAGLGVSGMVIKIIELLSGGGTP